METIKQIGTWFATGSIAFAGFYLAYNYDRETRIKKEEYISLKLEKVDKVIEKGILPLAEERTNALAHEIDDNRKANDDALRALRAEFFEYQVEHDKRYPPIWLVIIGIIALVMSLLSLFTQLWTVGRLNTRISILETKDK